MNKEIYLKILDTIEKEFCEIGNFCIEDNEVSFEVYRGYFEEAPNSIESQDKTISLNLIDKFDDPFYSLSYDIHLG
ncbi:MAG: hypothetical protein PHW73_13855 [Atribacterota bacterium]|nr:hypothetical protein [Atribacterota bacterium]